MRSFRPLAALALAVLALAIAWLALVRGDDDAGRLAKRACAETPGAAAPPAVPDVVGQPFDEALEGLRARHLAVSVAHFPRLRDVMPEQGWSGLDEYRVVTQSLRPGTTSAEVALRLAAPRFQGPLGSPVTRVDRPREAVVPDLVGSTYREAMALDPLDAGLWVALGKTGALSARASVCGLDAFVVAAQSPAPGTHLPWGGTTGRGVNPSRATITIDLVSVPPAAGERG